MLHPLLGLDGIFLILIVVSLIQGRISRRYATPIYRDENPKSFWTHITIYIVLGIVCVFFTLKNWTTEFDPPEYTWYTATADPQQSLETALQAASTIRRDGEIAYGLTSWNIHWYFQWSQAKHGDDCRISSVYATLSSRIILPKLVNATSAQQKKFNIFFDALHAHQLAHYEFGKSAAREIELKISRLPKMRDCATLEAAANALGVQILKDYQTKEQVYDLSSTFLQSQHALL